jgi:membrane protease subunit HflC
MNRIILIVCGIAVLVLGFIGFDAVYTVHQTQQALVLQFGRPIEVIREPGIHFKLPLLQDVEFFDRRILDLDPAPQEVILIDQKRVNVDSYVRYKIVDPLEFKKKAVTTTNFLQIFGNRLNSSVRAEVGKIELIDMLSEKRDDVMERITQQLKLQAPDFGIEVVDVRIGRTDLPDTTSQAVYLRMRSQRVAQAAQLRAEGAEIKARIQAEADRDRTIILANANRTAQILRGEGEGIKTSILIEAFGQDEEFFGFYRSMEAYGVALGENTTMVLSPKGEFFRYFGDISGKGPSGAK